MPAFAQQGKPADKTSQAKAEAPNVAEFDKRMAQVQENMKKRCRCSTSSTCG